MEINNDCLNEFINMYYVSKTLRFELIPQGQTQDWIKKKGLLEQNEILKVNYFYEAGIYT